MTIPETSQVAVSATIPAQHVSLYERFVAALKRDEQWIADNIHAGLTNLENLFKENDDADANNNGTNLSPAEGDGTDPA